MIFRNDRERAAWERVYRAAFHAAGALGPRYIQDHADQFIEAMREREAKPEPEAPVRGELGAIVEQVANSGAPAVSLHASAPRSERPALERVRKFVEGVIERRSLVPEPSLQSILGAIDAELARQPPDDSAEVEAVIEAARVVGDTASGWSRIQGVGVLCRALAALDRVRGKA